jgi:UDP-glucose 4-epimerase
MKKFILVTGGAGFIGSNLINCLLKKTKFKIISLDNYSTGLKRNHIKSNRVKYIKGENQDITSLLTMYKNNIITIFHFGEFSRIHQSFLNYEKCIRSNLKGSFEVITFATKNKIRIIYSATSSMLGNDGKDENLSPYSWSKSKNLELIKNFSKWFGLKYEIVFFYNVYGPGQIKKSNMSAVIGIFETLYENNRPLTVVMPGSQKRDFTHIFDIVEGCYLALKKGRQSEYMLGTKKQYSIVQIAKMFKTKIKYLPSRKGERFKSSITNNNAFNHLGYKSTIDISEYIKKFIS